ncbi:hypothetical protein ADEAN_000504600 [Angomonas deanei]|uniref:Uncharacterized protein n=1 Tax=Angomonas deanei TaxID=59799 RepID=A0A7G2CCM2_9TRYP|nr:hypothetical protein ADEAN_000504600 [Angomonas deanei]
MYDPRLSYDMCHLSYGPGFALLVVAAVLNVVLIVLPPVMHCKLHAKGDEERELIFVAVDDENGEMRPVPFDPTETYPEAEIVVNPTTGAPHEALSGLPPANYGILLQSAPSVQHTSR